MAEEVLKYKDAIRHCPKKAAETTSTREASASATTLEPEGIGGTGKGCEPRKTKGDTAPAVDPNVRKKRARVNKGCDKKRPGLQKDSKNDDARKTKKTADEKDLAGEESDQREYAALKNKMEARRIAREIQTAHDTIASLRAEQEDVSAKTETVSKARSESDRAKDGETPVLKTEIKRSRATRPAVGTGVGESGAPSKIDAPRRSEEQGKAKSTKIGEGKPTEIEAGPKKTVVKPKAKRPTSATEPPLKSGGRTATHSSDESMTEVLGPALVAGALGRKIGDTRTATMMRGITKCRVELLSTRQKARLPGPAAPNNSAESNSVMDVVGTYDVRLSLSATDQQVQLELPGDVTGITNETAIVEKGKTIARIVSPEPRRVSLTSVPKQSDVRSSHDATITLLRRTRWKKKLRPLWVKEKNRQPPGRSRHQ